MAHDATPNHPTAIQLLHAYLDNVRDPDKAAALFGDDGILELPTVQARAQGSDAVRGLLRGILKKVPDFRFKDLQVWIETPDKVFAEYSVEALVPETGRMYRQTYAGVLIAANGRIQRLREALDTAEAARAFGKA